MNYRTLTLLSTLVLACVTQTPALASPEQSTPPVSNDSITVKMADASPSKTVDLVCSDGSFRSSQPLTNGVTTFSEVPSGACTLEFKGGTPAKYTPARRGSTYNCAIIGQTAVCKEES